MRVTGYRSQGVAAAAALVNAVTVEGGDASDDALRKIMGDHHFFVWQFTPETGEAMRAFAPTLRRFFEAADLEEAVRLLNGLMLETSMHPHLADHDERGLHLHYSPPSATLGDRFRATSLMNLAELLADSGLNRIGVCAAPACDRVYADASRGGRRRFCSDSCANRTNVAAFRARARGQSRSG